LALAQAGGQVGPFKISYTSLDDSSPTTGEWDPGATATDAKTAAQDQSTIAYLGDFDSAASAISLPLVNAAGILQVSPASPYVGLTSSRDAGQDEPDRFYPTANRSFGRLMPADPVEADAQVHLMERLHVRRVYVIHDQDPFQLPLAEIVATEAKRARITVAAVDGLNITGTGGLAGEVSKVIASGAEAVFFSGGAEAGTVKLFKLLYAANPHLRLLGTSGLVQSKFTSALGGAGAATLLTTPVLDPRLYPASAQRLLSDYRRRFGSTPGPYVLDGYEAMSAVLLAIREGAAHGNERQVVIRQFFAIHDRDSVLGRYSIKPSGDSTLSYYGVDRIVNGQPSFYLALGTP
jgi:branched-chain amino acid transport system substrate-binding protein